MGFTPTGGLVMGTRSGDLDPGALVYLLENRHSSPGRLELAGQQSSRGCSAFRAPPPTCASCSPGVPRTSAPQAAVELFCYQAKKFLAAYAGALGGLDTVVFTGGIGEHAPEIREQICAEPGVFGPPARCRA